MEEKKSFGEKLGAFFAGKGFYIVLLLSAAVIGTSIWLINAERSAMQEKAAEPAIQVDRDDLVQRRVETAPETSTPKENESSRVILPEKPKGADSVPVMKTEDVPGITAESVFIRPVGGEVLREYSMDALRYDRTMSDWRTHAGCDLAAEPGETVMALTDGTVINVYDDALLGTVVEIDHGSGLVSVYANLAETDTVSVGQTVNAGDPVGTVGTGALGEIGEESHIHFAIRLNGETGDPGRWLPDN